MIDRSIARGNRTVFRNDVEDLGEEDAAQLPARGRCAVHVLDGRRLTLGWQRAAVELLDDEALERALDTNRPAVIRGGRQITDRQVLALGGSWRSLQLSHQARKLVESARVHTTRA